MATSRALFIVFLSLPLQAFGVIACAAEPVSFRRDVLPILSDRCFACHGFDPESREAGLRLDTHAGATAMLDSGLQAVVPGKPDESELLRRIGSTDVDEMMPPAKTGKQLTPAQQDILRRWIADGAEYEKHWAFLPPQAVEPPAIAGVAHPIDRFVQAELAKAKLAPSPPADDVTLIRRVSLDLIGLPPTPDEVDAFVVAAAVDREAAYAALVERLLGSPHYGERWGRWWLDQARYADSNGYSIDGPRQIWKYRDWVVAALNDDKPFDEFTIEQLAGDLLPDATIDQKIATGFHRNTQINQEGGIDREQFRIDSVFDRVATTGTVWLGLSVGCAQCHDHKFDPIEQKEFYRLFAFLNNQDEPTLKVYAPGVSASKLSADLKAAEKQLSAYLSDHDAELVSWETELLPAEKKKLPTTATRALAAAKEKRSVAQKAELFKLGPGRNDAEYAKVLARYQQVESRLNAVPTTLVLQESVKPRTTTVFIKGDFTRPADEVTPGTPAVLHAFENTTGQANRLDLARWIASPQNPLTARVIANRVWQQYFGRGLVETENDFGTQGTPPSHPELLDWLALSFIDDRGTNFRSSALRAPSSALPPRPWSLKQLHRAVVTSHTYRQSSADRADLRAKDPHNYLLGRQRRLRLDAEIVRDVALTASGLLSHKLGGPPVYPPIPAGAMSGGQVKRDWNVSAGEDRYRRGLYTFVFRATPPPSLNVFDAPDGYSSCTRRTRSNTPLQALTLMNDPAFFEFASALEKVIRKEGPATAFRRCTSRVPDAAELAVLKKLDPLSAARVLLNLDETVTRE